MTKFEQQLSRASQGDAIAQCSLGFMYDHGRGVEQDDTEAVRWYRLAAAQGDAGAQCNLGSMYATGRGVEQDDGEAACWYRLAAGQGQANAQFTLGHWYEEGRGVGQDDAEAARWFRLAAEQGEPLAQCRIGWMYDYGKGFEQSDDEAVRWYRAAAEQGDTNARFALGRMYADGRGVEQDEKEAARWYRLAADQGHGRAQEELKDKGADASWCAVEDLVEGMTVKMPEGVGRISKIDEPYFWVQWTEPNELKERGWAKKRYSIESLDHVEVLSEVPSDLSTENDLAVTQSSDTDLEQPKPDEPYWQWPISEPPEGAGAGSPVEFVHQFSALKMLGYAVGKTNGLADQERKEFLDLFFRNNLPGVVETHFPGEYGTPGSEQRLRKMANVLSANTRNFKRNNREKYRFAISDWEEDLAYLKKTFYDKGRHRFPWPSIEPR